MDIELKVLEARERGDELALARALVERANVALQQGMFGQAGEDFDEAATLHHKLTRTFDEATCMHRAASAYRFQGFYDEAVDRVLSIVMALAGEVSVLRERLDAHERLAAQHKLFGPADVDGFVPNDAAEAERDAWRDGFLRRVYRAVEQDIEAIAPSRRDEENYDEVIREIEGPTADEP